MRHSHREPQLKPEPSMRILSPLILAALLTAVPLGAQAGRGSEAVIGSIIGGATGAIIGHNLGGRDGAIVGGAIGAAAGVTIATDQNRNDGYDRNRGYQSAYDNDRRYDNRYDNRRNDRYDDRRDRRDDRYDRRREVVVVESPRYYYQGNDFVYGVPPPPPRYNGWDRRDDRRYDRGPDVVIIQQTPRYEGNYCPPPRRRW